MRIALVVLAAVGLAALTYFVIERLGRRGLVPFACRAVAWTALGLLLLNVSCPISGTARRPLVLLDASLSMTAAGGRWQAARDSALAWGEVQVFGDERVLRDTLPTRGRSLLFPALTAAAASDRAVLVVSDGEITDAADIPPTLLAQAGTRLFRRVPQPDLAITRVSGPERLTSGDSLALEVEVLAVGGAAADSVTVRLEAGQTRLAQRRVPMRGGAARARLVAVPALPAGEHLLRISLMDSAGAEPRTDTRIHHLTVAATPGVVLLAAPGDWDSRFLFQTLRDVARLPVRGYVRLTEGRWRSMSDLTAVSDDRVRQAARGADLLVLKGATDAYAGGSAARGIWRWPSGENGETVLTGDWYLGAADASPIAGAFLGAALDSFPPAARLTPVQPSAGEWVALTAQEGRRGAERPVVVGGEAGGKRRVTVSADGLWRWAFRGGSSEQTYRTWVAATASWLLGGADSVRGRARPFRPVVENGRPVLFEWVGSGTAAPVPLRWSGDLSRVDTLEFDGAGRAAVWLAPGEYRYAVEGGGGGAVAVETYSDEWLPRPVVLDERPARDRPASERSAARDWLWLFGLCVLALAGEWLARRRLGLR